ncbi:hypothetical protein ACFVH7_11770 [Kitasatospora indigofera]|uniref:hypothetical protein n=1 Tax=Kitasatospora indigofera TaxID=67307 RepID=UPI0036336AE7
MGRGRGGEGLVLRCGRWTVRAQFAASGAFVVAVADGLDGPQGHMSMPQALEILETRGPRCPAPESRRPQYAVHSSPARAASRRARF